MQPFPNLIGPKCTTTCTTHELTCKMISFGALCAVCLQAVLVGRVYTASIEQAVVSSRALVYPPSPEAQRLQVTIARTIFM